MRGLIVDDHELFREGLRLLLEYTAPDIVFDQCAGVSGAVDLLKQHNYRLVLLDWNLENVSGPQALERIRETAPLARVVVVSGENDRETVLAAIEAGASGFIPKSASPAVLTMALRLICAGGIYLPDGVLAARQTQPAQVDTAQVLLPSLTERQIEVFKALVRGMPNKAIGRLLEISDATVKVHVSAIFRALDVKNRTEAVYAAARKGLKVD